MRVKKFNQFLEAISGTEMIGSMGPNYGQPIGPTTISSSDTEAIYSEITDRIFSKDEYDDLYHKYLAKGGKPLHGYNKVNLDIILQELN